MVANMQTFKEILKLFSNWETLEIIDGEMYDKFTEIDLYGDYFENFVDDYKDTPVKSYTFTSEKELKFGIRKLTVLQIGR